MKPDTKLAAYAIALGYTLGPGSNPAGEFSPALFDDKGEVSGGLSFRKGRVTVWETAMGWRIGVMGEDGVYKRSVPGDFRKRLKAALDLGAKLPAAQSEPAKNLSLGRVDLSIICNTLQMIDEDAALALGDPACDRAETIADAISRLLASCDAKHFVIATC